MEGTEIFFLNVHSYSNHDIYNHYIILIPATRFGRRRLYLPETEVKTTFTEFTPDFVENVQDKERGNIYMITGKRD